MTIKHRTSRSNALKAFGLLLAAFLITAGYVAADVRLPKVFGSHMVLQRDIPVKVWGWAEPGEKVRLQMGGRSIEATAGPRGTWQAAFRPFPAGKNPLTLQIMGSGGTRIELNDILIGEVWVCSGQSNMEMALLSTHSPSMEIHKADFPNIRLFHIPRRTAVLPREDVDAEWTLCRPDTARSFSAVAYFFGREIHKTTGIPVGLIATSWGGTRIEPWTPPQGFQAVPEVSDILDEVTADRLTWRGHVQKALPEFKQWTAESAAALKKDADPPLPPALPIHPLDGRQRPTALYNGMIHALVPFGIRGALWYQGESNRNDGSIYGKKMEALIKGWRKMWGQGDFPFYWVQLAPYNYPYNREMTGGDIPDFLRLPIIWEAQTEALEIPNTGMAVTTDITDLYDIHPKNKQEVGRRLALWARAKVYGEKNLVHSGPLYRAMDVEGDKIHIRFDSTGDGLKSLDGQPLSWFEIAGANRVFYKAYAEIDGSTVLVSSPKVSNPAAVRFGWHQLAVPNLANTEGLPASPFRTDRW